MKKGAKVYIQNGRKVVRGLGYYEPRTAGDLRELVRGAVQRYGGSAGFKFKDREGRITGRTYLEFGRDIDSLGTALIDLGLKDSLISIIGENRYEWGVCYFSVTNGTGVAVPLDKHLPQNEVENLIDRGRVEAIFYSPSYHGMMTSIASANTRLKYYICMGEAEIPQGDSRFLSLAELIQKGRTLLEEGDRSFTEAQIDRRKMSVLLFTSGTTSMSKGVMLSHANLAGNVSAITAAIAVVPGDVHLSLLPLHHAFENTVGLLFMVHSGVCIAYCDGIKHVAQNFKEYGVTLFVAVPAILEAMYKRVMDGVRKSGKARAFSVLTGFSDLLRFFGIDLRRKLFKSVFQQLGPKLRLSVSGAAPLDPEIVKGFDRIGLRLLEGYGLTETSPVVAANNDFINKTGTIGFPLKGIEVAIDAPDENGMGEILTRGENVMLGYYEDPEATSEAIDAEGWFRTGDLGTIDKAGYIRITGRAKSMIVFTNGKKAFPEEYEVLLNNVRGVKDSFVWGNRAPDGDIQVCAKLVVDFEALAAEGEAPAEEELAAGFGAAVKDINKKLPQYKIIRYFVMSREELIKTTKLTIRRPREHERVMAGLAAAGLDMRKASGKFIEA